MSENPTETARGGITNALLDVINFPDNWPSGVVSGAKQMLEDLDSMAWPASTAKKRFGPIIAIDVDGTIHRYYKWQGANVLDGGPLPGAMEAIRDYVDAGYEVHIISSRLSQPGGMEATKRAIHSWAVSVLGEDGDRVFDGLVFSTTKPPSTMTIDDRAFQFRGVFPTVAEVKAFRPWKADDAIEPMERPNMDRALMTLAFGMVTSLALIAMRSNKADRARFAVESIHHLLASNKEELLAEAFNQVLNTDLEDLVDIPKGPARIIRVKRKPKTPAGLYFAESPDLGNFIACDDTPENLRKLIPDTIRDLYLADGQNVLVSELEDSKWDDETCYSTWVVMFLTP